MEDFVENVDWDLYGIVLKWGWIFLCIWECVEYVEFKIDLYENSRRSRDGNCGVCWRWVLVWEL